MIFSDPSFCSETFDLDFFRITCSFSEKNKIKNIIFLDIIISSLMSTNGDVSATEVKDYEPHW